MGVSLVVTNKRLRTAGLDCITTFIILNFWKVCLWKVLFIFCLCFQKVFVLFLCLKVCLKHLYNILNTTEKKTNTTLYIKQYFISHGKEYPYCLEVLQRFKANKDMEFVDCTAYNNISAGNTMFFKFTCWFIKNVKLRILLNQINKVLMQIYILVSYKLYLVITFYNLLPI